MAERDQDASEARRRSDQLCAPEWLVLYALRRHCERFLANQATRSPLSVRVALAGLAALIGARFLLPNAADRRRQRMRTMAHGVIVAAAVAYYVRGLRRQERERLTILSER